MRKTIIFFVLVAFVIGVVLVGKNKFMAFIMTPRDSSVTSGVTSSQIKDNSQKSTDENKKDIEVVADNLAIPWEMVFIDDTTMLVTERSGNLFKIELNGGNKNLIQKIEGVQHVGEGGLLGMALHPDFKNNHYIYLYSTTKNNSGLSNRVERYTLTENKLSDKKTIISNLKGASNHDGGRIAFGPDKYLYITIGDAEDVNSPQNKNLLNGKILRLTDNGLAPRDNPFGNAVYSFGHRNPQGLAWDDKGTLWSTEHGPSGSQTGNDELNLIEKGQNYGWPVIKGTQTKDGMVNPIIESGTKDTWAPGQVVFYKDSLFFAGLRGSALYQAKIENNKVIDFKQHFKSEYGRLRTIVLGPDGYFYIATSNKDGRGNPGQGDDKIIRVNPEIFFN